MKNRSLNILIVALLLLACMAVVLIVFVEDVHRKFGENIAVSSDGVTESIKEVKDLMLNPTESKEYSVNLVCEATGKYAIALEFIEKIDGGMKNFVDVTVKLGADVVYEGSLAELLDGGERIEFEGTLEDDVPLPVSVCYMMPYDVGNEAQGTSADFNVKLTVEKI